MRTSITTFSPQLKKPIAAAIALLLFFPISAVAQSEPERSNEERNLAPADEAPRQPLQLPAEKPPGAAFPPSEETELPSEGAAPPSEKGASEDTPPPPSNNDATPNEPTSATKEPGDDASTPELQGGTAEPTSSERPSDEARSAGGEEESSEELVPRLQDPKKSAPALPPPPVVPPVQSAPLGPPDRREKMPGAMVVRPLSLPQGTLLLEFALHTVFVDHAPGSARMPAFGLGITQRVELGLTAPYRFDESVGDWTALDPTPHLLVTVLDTESFEWGAQAAVLIPASNDTALQLSFELPLRVFPHERWRLDARPRFEASLDEDVGPALGLWLDATYQLGRATYLGWGAGPELGLAQGRQSGVDAHCILGATMQSQQQARVDLEGELFFENLGGGSPGHFSDGGGFVATLRFYPDIY